LSQIRTAKLTATVSVPLFYAIALTDSKPCWHNSPHDVCSAPENSPWSMFALNVLIQLAAWCLHW